MGDSITNSIKEKNKTNDAHDKNATIFYDFDVILSDIGGLKKYQLFLVSLVYWITLPAGMNQVASVFLAATPEYRCNLNPLDDPAYFDLTEKQLQQMLIPMDSHNESDFCRRYAYNLSECVSPDPSTCIHPSPAPIGFPTKKCDQGYYYDTKDYTSTVTTEFNLVCDDTIIGTSVTAVYFAGILFSSLFGGRLVDYFGRTPVMLVSTIGLSAFGVGCAYSPNLIGFTLLRFCIALFLQAGFIAAFVYNVEIVGKRWRTPVGIFTQLFFAIGYMILSGLAYKWRDWRELQFVISLVPLPFLIFYFFIPESPRWLFNQRKNLKAINISKKIAEKNGTEIKEDTWIKSIESGKKLLETNVEENASILELFKRPKMKLVTFNMMFNWFVNSLVYYGLSLNAGALAGTDFLNNTLNGLVEVGAYFVIVLTMDKLGRKVLLSGCLFIGGMGCIISLIFNSLADGRNAFVTAGTVFALVGKMAVSGSFAIIYNYTAELYPTSVRSTAVGLGSTTARIGSIITPYTLQLQDTIPWLTSVIFGSLALIASAFSLYFPETSGKQLPNTLEETEAFFRGETLSTNKQDEETKMNGRVNRAYSLTHTKL